MDRVPDVFLVHAHAECLRGAHDGELVVEEFLLDARTLVLSASMVGICKYAASSQVGQDSFARCWVLVKVVLEVREDDYKDIPKNLLATKESLEKLGYELDTNL